jgi:hypothetical protein
LNKFTCVRRDGTIAATGSSSNNHMGGIPGVSQLTDEGIHYACLYV